MKGMSIRMSVLAGLSLVLAMSSAAAQLRSSQDATLPAGSDDEQPVVQQRQQTSLQTNPLGRTAQSTAGQVGQRQTRDTAAQQAGIQPMARISNRIQNRVQNRVRNRIDRYYDPRANAADPFAVAEDQTRTTGRPR